MKPLRCLTLAALACLLAGPLPGVAFACLLAIAVEVAA